MKLNAMAFANAATIVVAVLYVVCAVISVAWPSLIMTIAQSWVHSLDLSKLAGGSVSATSLTVGLISLSALTWVVDYLFAVIYNALISGSGQ